MAIYAYADETIFTIDDITNQKALGCGILISQTELTQAIIEEALYDLENDVDFELKRDQRTIDRRYFHASDDSKNAHSHFCKAINKKVKGIFDFSYFDNVIEKELSRTKIKENMLARCLTASTLEFFNSTDEVHLVIEKRDGLTEYATLEWLKNLYRLYEETTYNIPSFKTYFPKINIDLRNKLEPGLQIIDFLIWSINRTKRKSPDNNWQKRLLFKTWSHYRDENGHNRAKYYLNTFTTYNSKSENYPHHFEEPEEWHLFIDAYILIERFLTSLDISDFTIQSNHLFKEFDLISSRLKDKDYHLNSNDLDLIGRIFLKLFDTLPIYKDVKDEDKQAWTLLFHTKYLASMLVRNGQIHFNRTKDEIQRWRYRMKKERSDEFYQLMSNK